MSKDGVVAITFSNISFTEVETIQQTGKYVCLDSH